MILNVDPYQTLSSSLNITDLHIYSLSLPQIRALKFMVNEGNYMLRHNSECESVHLEGQNTILSLHFLKVSCKFNSSNTDIRHVYRIKNCCQSNWSVSRSTFRKTTEKCVFYYMRMPKQYHKRNINSVIFVNCRH